MLDLDSGKDGEPVVNVGYDYHAKEFALTTQQQRAKASGVLVNVQLGRHITAFVQFFHPVETLDSGQRLSHLLDVWNAPICYKRKQMETRKWKRKRKGDSVRYKSVDHAAGPGQTENPCPRDFNCAREKPSFLSTEQVLKDPAL